MNPSLILLALLAADPFGDFATGNVQRTVYDPQAPFEVSVAEDDLPPIVVRAQGSPYYGGGGTPPTYSAPGGVISPQPANPGGFDPFVQPPTAPYAVPNGTPITGDPFVGGTAAPAPYGYDPFGRPPAAGYTFGLNGPQPFRYGWQARYDFGYMPSAGTSSPNVGDLSIFAADFEKELVTPIGGGFAFSLAPQFNFRSWDGPLGVAGGNAGLPPEAYRFGLGLNLATPTYGAWQFEVGFNPSIGTDFSNGLSSEAVMYDGHAALFYRSSPQWMFALGAAYWDRVDNIILPYAGAVWTPNDYLEFRLLFPNPSIQWFVGAPMGVPTWLYASGEYHVEAYEVNVDPINKSSRVQFEDWRVLGGARAEFGAVTTFLEAGWILGRSVEFEKPFATDFDIDSGFIVRAGFRY